MQTMTTRIAARCAALVLAFIVTAGLLGGVDHLAGAQPAGSVWMAAMAAPRA